MANYQVGQPGGDWTGLTQGNVNNQAFQAAQQQAEHDRLVGYADTAALVRVKDCHAGSKSVGCRRL